MQVLERKGLDSLFQSVLVFLLRENVTHVAKEKIRNVERESAAILSTIATNVLLFSYNAPIFRVFSSL